VYLNLIYRSTDGGLTWQKGNDPFGNQTPVNALTFDTSGTLYAAFPGMGFYVSKDRGNSWTRMGTPTTQLVNNGLGASISAVTALGSAGTVVTELSQVANAGFVSKLSADGATLEFSTYLRAHATPEVFQFYAGEPAPMIGQTFISGVTLDQQENVVL